MIEVIASAFVDEIECLQLEKWAADFDVAGHNKVVDAVANRWRAAGISSEFIDEALYGPGGMAEKLTRLRDSAGAAGSPTEAGARERVRQVTREYGSKFAPRKTLPQSWLGAQVAKFRGEENPYKSKRVTLPKSKQTSAVGEFIRGKLGIEPINDYAGTSRAVSNLERLVPDDPQSLKKSLQQSGEKIHGARALKDLKSGTASGAANAARKVLGPALNSMPPALKIGAGIGLGVAGKKVLFGDDRKTTISVG